MAQQLVEFALRHNKLSKAWQMYGQAERSGLASTYLATRRRPVDRRGARTARGGGAGRDPRRRRRARARRAPVLEPDQELRRARRVGRADDVLQRARRDGHANAYVFNAALMAGGAAAATVARGGGGGGGGRPRRGRDARRAAPRACCG